MKYINWLWGILVAGLGFFIWKKSSDSKNDQIITETQAKIDGFKTVIQKLSDQEKQNVTKSDEIKKENEGKTDEELSNYFNSRKSDQ